MGKMFYGYFGWMCYDCRTVYPSMLEALKEAEKKRIKLKYCEIGVK